MNRDQAIELARWTFQQHANRDLWPSFEPHDWVIDAIRMAHAGQVPPIAQDLKAHLYRQREFSERTFGPGARTAAMLDHIRRELVEVESKPGDVYEWIDVVLLALDGAWRAGHSPEDIVLALAVKQERNERRTWPDWRTQPADRAIEHIPSEQEP